MLLWFYVEIKYLLSLSLLLLTCKKIEWTRKRPFMCLTTTWVHQDTRTAESRRREKVFYSTLPAFLILFLPLSLLQCSLSKCITLFFVLCYNDTYRSPPGPLIGRCSGHSSSSSSLSPHHIEHAILGNLGPVLFFCCLHLACSTTK